MGKIGKEITRNEWEKMKSNELFIDRNYIEFLSFFALRPKYFRGTIVLVKEDEKVSSILEQIDTNIEKLGITYYREKAGKIYNPDKYPIDLTDVKFERFPNLKICEIKWTSIGINNDTFNNCNNLEILNLGTPLDYPFDENNCSSLYTLTNLHP